MQRTVKTKANFLSAAMVILAAIILVTSGVSYGQQRKAVGERGGGGGGTQTPTPTPSPNPLPQTPPEPGVLYRESFGQADLYRPTGGKGDMRTDYLHTPIQGYWIEYPGSKNTNWIASDTGQAWRFCGASDNPYEMFSPIQVTYGNGCVASEWFDIPTVDPTALMPVTLPATPYEVSFNGYPAPIEGKYLALGLTNSGALYSNLATNANIVLVLLPTAPFPSYGLAYELRAGGMNGTLLASGQTFFDSWNQFRIRIDPVAHTVGGSMNGTDLGTYSLDIGVPRYAGFEGVGIGDNFVIRTVQ